MPPLHPSQSTTWTFVTFVIKFIFSGFTWDFFPVIYSSFSNYFYSLTLQNTTSEIFLPCARNQKSPNLTRGGEGEAAVINETDSLGFIGLPAFHPGWEVSTFYGCWRGRRRGVTGGSVTALEGEFGQERESIRSWIIVYCWFLFHIRGIVTIAFIVLSAHWGLSDLKHLPAALGCNHFDSHGLHKAFYNANFSGVALAVTEQEINLTNWDKLRLLVLIYCLQLQAPTV